MMVIPAMLAHGGELADFASMLLHTVLVPLLLASLILIVVLGVGRVLVGAFGLMPSEDQRRGWVGLLLGALAVIVTAVVMKTVFGRLLAF